MAHMYSNSVATPAPVTVAPYATIAAAASTRVKVTEIGLFCNAATASSIGLYRATNTFVSTTNSTAVQDDYSDEAGSSLIGTTWSTAPTIGSNVALRRIVLPAAIGAGVIWQFPDGLMIGPAGTSGLVVWNFGASTASVLQMYVASDR